MTQKAQLTVDGRVVYVCETCEERYEMSDARRKEMACCGQPLTRTEVATKSDPTPFGP